MKSVANPKLYRDIDTLGFFNMRVCPAIIELTMEMKKK